MEKKRDDYAADVTAAYDTTKGGKTQAQWQADYNEYKASYDSYIANRDKYANYDSLSQEERETLDKDNPGGYENYKRFSAQKAAYDSYLANKERFDNLSQSERETLEKNGGRGFVCGFAGPLRREENGRGYFAGIGIHSDYRSRGLGSCLFAALCRGLKSVGADYMTLFTGTDGTASRIYEKAGFTPAARFSAMEKTLY